jgi:hypothetical protein
MCVPSQESQPSDGSGFLCFRMNRAGGFFKNPIQKKVERAFMHKVLGYQCKSAPSTKDQHQGCFPCKVVSLES